MPSYTQSLAKWFSSLTIEDVPDDYILSVAQVMIRARWHTYQVLTKRPERMLKMLRTKLGYSQDQLACGAGVDRAYVGGLERREGNPTVEMLERLAKTLSIPLAEFFTVPQEGSTAPKPLRCGRKSRR